MEITFPYLPGIGLHLFVIMALVALAAYLWHYRQTPGVMPLISTLGARVLWLTCVVMISASSSLQWQIVWHKLVFLPAIILIPSWLVFILQVSGRDSWLTWRRLAAIIFVPAVGILIIFTNEWHGWYTRRGLLHWLMLDYYYLLALVCWYINIQWIRQSSGLRRRQAVTIAIGPLFSVAGQVAGLFSQSVYAPMALPVGFLLSALIWCWALLHWRIFRLIPIAKETVINNMGDGFAVVDNRGFIYELNPAAAATLGIAVSQAVGRQAYEVFAGWPDLADLAQSQGVKERDAFLEKDGGTRHFELHRSPLVDGSGQILGSAIVWHDATERHLAHAQLKLMEESRRRLVANISHDLRTPVSSVLGHVEMLLEEIAESPEQQRTYLKRIHAKMLGFNRLIQDLFELVKIESQQVHFHLTQVSATKLVEDTYQKYLFDVQNAGIKFECNTAFAADVMILADVDRLDQIFANLISNATTYIGSGGAITISCEFAKNQDSEPYRQSVLFKVADDGPGMAPEHIPHVFERFYRASEARQASSEHSGLGLAIAKEIAVAHGGHIWVDTTVSRGCTICFTFPTGG